MDAARAKADACAACCSSTVQTARAVAGRLVQVQNLPQNHLPDLAEARELVRQGNYEALELLYDSIPDVLSQLIRTAFVPRKGMKFVVSDFSAIEARVLSWLAGETWRLDVFARNGDIYCASASSMFGVPVEKHGVNGHLRQKGKIAELALGYGGSTGALKAMGALDMGLTENELYPLVQSWRSANPHIVDFWWQVDATVKTAIKEQIPMRAGCIRFLCQSGMLFIQLPSGRRLSYVKPRIGENASAGNPSPMKASAQRKSGNGWRATARSSWKTSSRHQPGYPLLCHADAVTLPDLRSCA